MIVTRYGGGSIDLEHTFVDDEGKTITQHVYVALPDEEYDSEGYVSVVNVYPRGRWKLSRYCYNKPHRCAGWSGGGWTSPQVQHCKSGYTTAYDDKWYKIGRCNKCSTRFWPVWTRNVDPTYWKWAVGRRWDNLKDEWSVRHG